MNVSFFSRFSLKSRFFVLIVVILAGFLSPRLIANFMIEQVRIGSPVYREIAELRQGIADISSIEADLNLIRSESYHLFLTADGQERTIISRSISAADKRILSTLDRLGKLLPSSESSRIRELKRTLAEIDSSLDRATGSGTGSDSVRLLESQQRFYDSFRSGLHSLRNTIAAEISSREADTDLKIGSLLTNALFLSLIILVIAVVLIVSIIRSITASLESARAFAQKIGEGDLTERMEEPPSADELGVVALSLNGMVGSLAGTFTTVAGTVRVMQDVSSNLGSLVSTIHKLGTGQHDAIESTTTALQNLEESIDRVNEGMNALISSGEDTTTSIQQLSVSIDTIAQTVEQLTRSVDDVSSSIVEMAASLRQVSASVSSLVDVSAVTSSSIFQMDASIRDVLEHAAETAAIAADVLSDAEDGRVAVRETMLSMKQIHDASVTATQVIDSLSDRVESIGTIISVIDEIAEQTNLLALNAAIIASQAGEHGKGFAVVADEVRELSERTSSSTREIGDLIRSVQEETQRAVTAISTSQETIAVGEALSARSGAALDKIVAGITEASRRMKQIATSTEEQGKGSEVIKNAAAEFASMVEQIASASNEQSRTSELIMNAAENMRSLTHEVRVATQDQSAFGRTISHSTHKMLEHLQLIHDECHTERTSAAAIREAMTALSSMNRLVRDTSLVLNESVDTLSRNAAAMGEELGKYRLPDTNSSSESESEHEPH